MKTLILFFSLLTFGSSNTWASNLLPYIEMPIESQNLIAFSSQGIQFKNCSTCSTTKLKPNKNVAYYEHNAPITLKQATELFINKQYDSVSIFYDRHTNTYDQVVFGGFIEVEPFQTHPNAQ